MKLAMAKLLAKYKILPTPETKLDYLKGSLMVLEFTDFKVKLKKLWGSEHTDLNSTTYKCLYVYYSKNANKM